MAPSDHLMDKIVSLCKRRGFVFQSSDLYGGLRSAYDFGPLGVELKRNIAAAWWRDVVTGRDDVYGLDAAIIMHPKVWRSSGHVDHFNDPLVDCLNCHERFRADKAPRHTVGSTLEYAIYRNGNPSSQQQRGVVGEAGYVCPRCSSPQLSAERLFSGMFKTTLGAVDPLGEFVNRVAGRALSAEELAATLREVMAPATAYLRPETAQAAFVQFLNVQKAMGAKLPFGIAQIGKSFRNEIIVEHFIFRSIEFEQMELEFFCDPDTAPHWFAYWKDQRLDWYRRYAACPEKFRLREHAPDERAHYSDACFDIEFAYPWGWDELEGVASRTDYDLRKHAAGSGNKIRYFDPHKIDPTRHEPGSSYVPYVIEPAAGLTRCVLAFLLDAYHEEEIADAQGGTRQRSVLRLHPRLAPYTYALLPLVKKDGQPEAAQKIHAACRDAGLSGIFDANQSIGKRYAKHDEIGTPFCVTVDNASLATGQVTVRHRDSTRQDVIDMDQLVAFLGDHLRQSS